MRTFLCITLAMLLAGCGGQPASDGRIPVRVFLLLISTKQVAHYQWAEEAFEAANPDIDIIIEQFPGSSLKDFEIKLRLRFSSGQAPEVFLVHENVAAALAHLGLLAPAPPDIEAMVRTNSRSEAIRDAAFFDDTCYGVVSESVHTVLYYNKQMFREAGLDPERPPATWDELLDYADRLTLRRADGTPTRAGLSLRKTGFKPGTAEKWFTFLYSAGGTPFSPDGTRATFNSEAGRAALDLYRQVLFEKNIDSVELEGDQQGFGQERVAMFIREVHVIRWLRENYPDLDFGVAPIPAKTASISSGGSYLFAVSADAPQPEAAWRFVRFLMEDEAYARYAAIGGVIPTTRTVAALPVYREDPLLQVFMNQEMRAVKPFPHVLRATERLGAFLERFCYGHLDAETTLRRAEENINAILLRQSPSARVDFGF